MKNNLKYELIKKLVLTDDESVLEQVKELLEGNATSFWSELNPKLKESIERGLGQSNLNIDADFSHEDILKHARTFIKNEDRMDT